MDYVKPKCAVVDCSSCRYIDQMMAQAEKNSPKPLRKIMITPYFGTLPPWFGKFMANFNATLGKQGYAWLIDPDIESFRERVRSKLGIEYPGLPGTGKVWDYRGALGYLYSDEISGYDFWGHMDFDMCFGDVSKWITDDFLSKLDVHSNHNTYVCGCWTLYRNTPKVNELFMQFPEWKSKMLLPEANGWVEEEFSRTLEASGLRYAYTFWQGDPYSPPFNMKFENGKLYQDGVEIAMLHFRRNKVWPL